MAIYPLADKEESSHIAPPTNWPGDATWLLRRIDLEEMHRTRVRSYSLLARGTSAEAGPLGIPPGAFSLTSMAVYRAIMSQ
jgi:hypothetical protein